jgi:starch synthase
VVSRLTPQKGLDLLLAALPGLVEGGAALALLGAGDADLEAGFAAAAASYPGAVAAHIGYDDKLAHLIIGAADVVLVPSRYEPCGLTQLYALRYGALPLVRRVGGLADTVVDATAVTLADGTATGFAFDATSLEALRAAIDRSRNLFAERALWQRIVRQAMTRDFSWAAAARHYLALYRALHPAPAG